MVPIVLVRGLLRESGHWQRMIDAFTALDPDLVIITPNVPGNGALFQQRSPTNIESMLPSVLHQLPSDCERYHLVAISMGSMLASSWAHRLPNNVASLTLINPSFSRYSHFWQRINLLKLPYLCGSKLLGSKPFETAVLNVTYPRHVSQPDVLHHYLTLRQSHPVSFSNALRQLIAAARFKGPAIAPRCPTLVITSESDQLVSSQAGLAIAKAWGVQHMCYASDAHDLPSEKPEELARFLYGWFQKFI
ncbi:alpha/beta fold hydrolase [Vibrio sp. 10N.261.51.F12]|uniref:alpha/beta fold hydrolase n=1 Tax=Vibrio sp. 10N.261.51.F12 TaxID=3229679 RepID=UPI00354D552F